MALAYAGPQTVSKPRSLAVPRRLWLLEASRDLVGCRFVGVGAQR